MILHETSPNVSITSSISDAQGCYSIHAPCLVGLVLRTSHPCYHGNDYRLKLAAAEEKHGVNVEVVPRNGLIRGKVRCYTTGSLIPNATVRASDSKALKRRSDDNRVYELENPHT